MKQRCYEIRECIICGKEFKVIFASKIARKRLQMHGKKRKIACSPECSKKLASKECHEWQKNEYKINPSFRQKRLDYMKRYNKTRIWTPEQKQRLRDDQKKWAEKNKTYRRDLKRETKKIYCEKLGNKCAKCGIKVTDDNLCIFDFHHPEPLKKPMHERIGRESPDNKNFEIEKVILLCSNCHKIEHYNK